MQKLWGNKIGDLTFCLNFRILAVATILNADSFSIRKIQPALRVKFLAFAFSLVALVVSASYIIMKKIALSKQGKHKGKYFALVDDADYDWLNQWRWCVLIRKHTCYAHRINRNKNTNTSILMHRFIMSIVDSKNQVDHKNLNGLDNQRHNIRKCSQVQNQRNKNSIKNSTSKFKGVHYSSRDKIWISTIKVNKKGKHLGQFKNDIDAAIMYNFAAHRRFGEYALLNEIPTQQ